MNGTVARKIEIKQLTLLSLTFGAFLISFSGVWVKVAHVAPNVSAFYRVFIGGFALMAAAVKFAGDLPLTMKVFFRNLVTLGITSIMAVKLRENPFGPTPHGWRLLFRSLCGLGGVLLYFLALGKLNLADASLLNKTSPFFVLVFAVVFLLVLGAALTRLAWTGHEGGLLVHHHGVRADLPASPVPGEEKEHD